MPADPGTVIFSTSSLLKGFDVPARNHLRRVGLEMRAQCPQVDCTMAALYVPLYQTPAEARRWHHVVRRATSVEIDVATRRLDAETDALSTGKITQLIRWLTGRETRRDADDDFDGQRRAEFLRWLRGALESTSPAGAYPGLHDVGRQRVLDMLRRKLWRRKHTAKPPLLAPRLVSPCTAHTQELASTITRHGPPQPSTRHRPLPGVSVCW